jgi:hypothetical protein
MSFRNLSWKALLLGTIALVSSWLFLQALLGLAGFLFLDLILGWPPFDADAFDQFVREYNYWGRFAVLASGFAGTILAFALGGYIAARISSSQFLLHALVVVLLCITVFAIAWPVRDLFMFAQNSIVAVLAGIIGGRFAIRRKSASSDELLEI